MKDLTQMRVLISGGGTGGHIYPAIAIANEVKARYPMAQIKFVGAIGRMEMEKVPKAGYDIEGLPIAGLQRSLSIQNLKLPFKLIKSLWMARQIVKTFKPDITIGVGGYASGPLLWSAANAKVPVLIQEQNSFAGITNKIMAKKAATICVAYSGMEKFFPSNKIKLTGNPVRQDILELNGKKQQGLGFFGLDDSKKTILVIGGSLGARTINESILQGLSKIDTEQYNLIWQTGKNFIEIAKKAVEGRKSTYVSDFVYQMDLAYAVADIVISRAGALSVSELCLAAKPTIFVPSPNVSEDHQTKNAMALVSVGAAQMVTDVAARTSLVDELLNLLNNQILQDQYVAAISKLAKPKATKEIVDLMENMLKS
jgi:UDP-N-acetylglucosamine--N-acetylmuramyl-(pentapeptide) pyrophosphoryl-undecaprenol N-acetylglucosamine transferase